MHRRDSCLVACFLFSSIFEFRNVQTARDCSTQVQIETGYSVAGRACLTQVGELHNNKNIAHNQYFDLAFACKCSFRKRNIKSVKIHYFMECTVWTHAHTYTNTWIHCTMHISVPMVLSCRCVSARAQATSKCNIYSELDLSITIRNVRWTFFFPSSRWLSGQHL